jgi:hypothetical protein
MKLRVQLFGWRVSAVAALVALLSGCGKKPTAEASSGHNYWVIRSWESGKINAIFDGNVYAATCDRSYFINPKLTGPDSARASENCTLAAEMVGRKIQPFGGTEKDVDGNIVVMMNASGMLAVRTMKGVEGAPWRQENYVITSVNKGTE